MIVLATDEQKDLQSKISATKESTKSRTLETNYNITVPSSTIRQREYQGTQPQYTKYNQTNSWSHHISFSSMNTQANAWNARCHQGNGKIAVQRLVLLLKL